MNQAYCWLSKFQGHITDCKLDSVVHAGVYGCRCEELIRTCLFGSNDPFFECHATDSIASERYHSDHYASSEPASRFPAYCYIR